MHRPFHVWSLFAAALAVVAAALVWLTLAVLRVDGQAAEAAWQAAVEEDVRLALWRIDSNVATLVAQENARPYLAYRAVFSPANPDEPLPKTLDTTAGLVASPLAGQIPPYVRLYFQVDEAGLAASPQVPPEGLRAWVQSGNAPGVKLDFSEAESLLAEVGGKIDIDRLCNALPQLDPSPTMLLMTPPLAANPAPNGPGVEQQEVQQSAIFAQTPQVARNGRGVQSRRNNDEFNQRAQNYQQLNVANNTIINQNMGDLFNPAQDAHVGLIRPVWLDGELLLARRVRVRQQELVQACWIDWPQLRLALAESVRDLLPNASLQPMPGEPHANRERLLASLPVQLLPGAARLPAMSGLSPLKWTLAAAWICLGLAALAVAALLAGVLALSERRAAFVSAVTHELRTPLTTFRMYAEMLAGGMVPDQTRRQKYLDTLRVEADRLSHLVENVLAYARLERGVSPARVQPVALGELLDRARSRLLDRAEQAGMHLTIEIPADLRAAQAQAECAAVEQILFNLVDNACKYGTTTAEAEVCGPNLPAAAGTIFLTASRRNGHLVLSVRDEGLGISAADRKRLFRPFCKSARQAAVTAPGVGLGLALSRRLARQLGGDLQLQENGEGGAAFELRLREQPGQV
ncbi:MAG: sensor histidine kinase [Pirellulales bacterium]